ncbi:hypothetical protein GCM10023187_08310 [Nibrella viscosa]|uniref:Gliding motility-associated C-terminal domain-containing protein n=1 Tax=Nibrella viscosa TaxID=1084524 RepID=A0ABP8JZI4_9BACT
MALILSSAPACSQCATSGSFTGSLRIRNAIGCVPLTVRTSSDLVGVRNVRYVYEYDGRNESRTSLDTTYTYKRPGLYQILQLSEKDGLPLRACGTVMVYDTVPPVFTLATCRNEVRLTIPNAGTYPYDFFLVTWGDGTVDTLRVTEPSRGHTYPDNATRRIVVQGSFRYASCGGRTGQTFTPASAAAMPFIREVVRTGPQTLQLTLSNPANTRVRVQQRGADGRYTEPGPVADGSAVRVRVANDSTAISCFRLVLADSCVTANPSAEVCYEPPVTPTPSVSASSQWFLPDAFTPNGDGINDTFGLVGTVPAGAFRLTVFDRWGRVLFDTSDSARFWDGTQAGQAVSGGMYGYRLEVTANGQSRHQRTGRVLLMR